MWIGIPTVRTCTATTSVSYTHLLTKVVRVKYYNIFYNTKQIEGHRQDPVKREQMKIDNQKQLEQVLSCLLYTSRCV